MKKNRLGRLRISLGFLTAFVLWTLAIRQLDVQAIGPKDSTVGFATLNQFIHCLTGVNMTLYTITDWLSIVPLGFVLGFACLGCLQWLQRKRLLAVDRNILVLGCFYLAVMAIFLLFEVLIVNYRPVLIDGRLEASYPSSTTMLVLTVIPTAVMQLNIRIKNAALKKVTTATMIAFLLFMVLGRLVSGVHWFTDIIGGILLSAGLVAAYAAFAE